MYTVNLRDSHHTTNASRNPIIMLSYTVYHINPHTDRNRDIMYMHLPATYLVGGVRHVGHRQSGPTTEEVENLLRGRKYDFIVKGRTVQVYYTYWRLLPLVVLVVFVDHVTRVDDGGI
jgi:hypothetical protein